jgi:UDP-N-acetylglucosamine 2-epimerase (non-hydrolysing)
MSIQARDLPIKAPYAKVLVIFGTRPEAIKLAPVIAALNQHKQFKVVSAFTGQHAHLADQARKLFGLVPDHELRVMTANQPLNVLCSRLFEKLDRLLLREAPDLIVVQGDTTSAMAGALAGFHRQIPVAHVEAGLRTNDVASPFPEEANRQMITRLATYHLAATPGNVRNLVREGVPAGRIALTGNPIVDALHRTLEQTTCEDELAALLDGHFHRRLIVLTTHRRESFGGRMLANLRAIRSHVDGIDDLFVLFPVHPNPAVSAAAVETLGGHPRIRLIEPLGYALFVHLLARAWLIISDSGGLQEEAPTLRRPLIVLRETTERPEAVECGVARLSGGSPARLRLLLQEAERQGEWFRRIAACENPFGRGDAGERIADALLRFHTSHFNLAPVGAA